LTNNASSFQASSAWFPTIVNIQNFTTDFQFQLTAGTNIADGFTWTLQANSTAALGSFGGDLGYTGIGKSVAVKFDLYNNSGEGSNSTGLYLNGASPTVPAIDMTGTGIDLHSGDVFKVHMSYGGANLVMSITDAVTNATFTTTWAVNIPGTLGATAAYAGFTAGTGGYTALQSILNWTMNNSTGTTGTVATPVFSPAAGVYLGTQTVTLSDATSGATIFYTLDGTQPGTATGGSTLQYSTPLTVSSTTTIKALATASGQTASATASATYTIQSQVATPTFSPLGGTYTSAQTVTISTATSGATIYYTTNGTTPTTSSTVYAAPITVSTTETLEALAVKSGYTNSNVATATYTMQMQAATPIFSPLGGTYASAQTVSISTATSGATIYYTTNGTTPTTSSTVYTAPITVSTTETLEALAVKSGYTNSNVATATYTMQMQAATPIFSPLGGTYASAQTVSISTTTSGATIYYTTNGTTPTTSSTVYTAPITVSATETVEALAAKSGYTDSNVATAAYTIQAPVTTPTLTSASPNSATQGQINLAVTLTGTNFLPGPVCSFGSGIIINSCLYNSATTISTNIAVQPSAAIGTRNVTVTNSDGKVATLTNGFKVRRHP
jgi:hypothetical protein